MNFQLPWESKAIIHSPWLMQATMLSVAFLLSLLSWFRSRVKMKGNQQGEDTK
ncbi:MAG: hypothetical protein K0S39_6020 [Paenibacillus sp.]|jgi:hypothetical protein|nr:hypothetical protein [Paenibacillus sp.]